MSSDVDDLSRYTYSNGLRWFQLASDGDDDSDDADDDTNQVVWGLMLWGPARIDE